MHRDKLDEERFNYGKNMFFLQIISVGNVLHNLFHKMIYHRKMHSIGFPAFRSETFSADAWVNVCR